MNISCGRAPLAQYLARVSSRERIGIKLKKRMPSG